MGSGGDWSGLMTDVMYAGAAADFEGGHSGVLSSTTSRIFVAS